MNSNALPPRRRRAARTRLLILAAAALAPATVHADGCSGNGAACPPDLAINDIQAVGSHNSYKIAIPDDELAMIAQSSPEAALGLDYGHAPLTEQLNLGMRQLELDLFYDPEGGRYADPLLPRLSTAATGEPTYDASGMQAPGFKAMHVQDIDQRSTCATFILCLREIRTWSQANPRHAPILILINAKEGALDFPGAKEPIPFDETAFDAFDKEILSVFPAERLITPDDVRGDAATLRDAVLAGGWPNLEAARGKMIFAIDENPNKTALYRRGKASLEGLPAFVNSRDEAADHAAYFTMNDPVRDQEAIKARVAKGFLVRTRADADTREARADDASRREAAFASGAHYISTDYYYPRTEWSGYSVRLPGGAPIRCNPVRVDAAGCGR